MRIVAPIRTTRTGEQTLDRTQVQLADAVRANAQQMDSWQICMTSVNGTTSSLVSMPGAGASTRIVHQLGRVPVGWQIVDMVDGAGVIGPRTAWDATSITLTNTGATCRVVVRVQ